MINSAEKLLHKLAEFQMGLLENDQSARALTAKLERQAEEILSLREALETTHQQLRHSRREFDRMNKLEQEASNQVDMLKGLLTAKKGKKK